VIIIATYFKPLRISKFERKGHVSNLFILPEHRSKGIGNKLVEEALTWLKKNDVGYVSLEIHLENKKAIDFYSKLGFEKYTIKLYKKI